MRVIREESSSRLRASLRGVLPAVATLLVLLLGQIMLRVALAPKGVALSLGGTMLVRFVLVVLYVGMIGSGVWVAAVLDRRHYTEFGLDVDRAWFRNFAAGAVFSASGIVLALWWGLFRGFRSIDRPVAVSGPDGLVYLGFALLVYVLYFLLGNVYEEIIYRGVMLQNFAEGLASRGFSPAWAVGPATAASLVLFGAYHVPLRGNFVVAIDAAMVGVTFALAYLLTGELGLALGVHFGRITFELLTGFESLQVEVPAILVLTRDTLMVNLELRLLELGSICLFILTWVYLNDGEIRVAETVCERADDGSDAD